MIFAYKGNQYLNLSVHKKPKPEKSGDGKLRVLML